MPRGLSSERAAAFSPLTNSFRTSDSSLMMKTRLTGFFMEPREKPDCCGKPRGAQEGGAILGALRDPGDAAFAGVTPLKLGESGRVADRRPFGAESAGHRLEPQRKAALVPRSLVLVDHFLVGDAVDDAARIAQGFARGGLVAGLNCPGDALDRARQRRAQARVVPAPRFGLTGRLARALRIRHVGP